MIRWARRFSLCPVTLAMITGVTQPAMCVPVPSLVKLIFSSSARCLADTVHSIILADGQELSLIMLVYLRTNSHMAPLDPAPPPPADVEL